MIAPTSDLDRLDILFHIVFMPIIVVERPRLVESLSSRIISDLKIVSQTANTTLACTPSKLTAVLGGYAASLGPLMAFEDTLNLVGIAESQEVFNHFGLKECHDVYLDTELTLVVTAKRIYFAIGFQDNCVVVTTTSELNGIVSETPTLNKFRYIS